MHQDGDSEHKGTMFAHRRQRFYFESQGEERSEAEKYSKAFRLLLTVRQQVGGTQYVTIYPKEEL